MHLTICDLCKNQITGTPQGEGEGNPDMAKNVKLWDGPPSSTLHVDFEVCFRCFESIKVAIAALSIDRPTTVTKPR